VALLLALVASGCSAERQVAIGHHRRLVKGEAVVQASTTTQPPTTTSTTSLGSLPQTNALPPASSPQLSTEIGALWSGIVEDSASEAMEAFFPEGAYLQVKDISNPGGDYQNRLVAEFAMDIHAAHLYVMSHSATPIFKYFEVPEQYAHWVDPNTCYNAVGYYEVPNARIVFDAGGQIYSFGIASMISWRGQWYVVHLGAVLRSSDTGIVDDPASGAGVSSPSSTC
jgi:hypothetical protein